MQVRSFLIPCAALVVLCAVVGASAQTPATNPQREPGTDLVVAILTMAPGDAVYEWFGHNAILIENTRTGKSVCFNYGLFDPGEHGFILRFLQGRMDYWMGAFGTAETIEEYRKLNRTVIRQELELTPTQRVALWNYLEWNQRPENATYRYDYYTANCSTKVRDALDLLLEWRLKKRLEGVKTERTYRWHTRAANRRNPVMFTAMDYLMGPLVDVPLSAWEESFLPERLAAHLRGVMVVDAQGREAPLVKGESVVFQAKRVEIPEGPPKWLIQYGVLGIVIGAAVYGSARLTKRGGKWRVAFAALAGCWALVVGGMGTFLAGLWGFTTHVATYRNENLFHFNPLALGLVVLAPMMVMGNRRGGILAWWIAVGMLGFSVVGLVVQVLPGFDQVNGEMIAWMTPANLGLFFGIDLLTRRVVVEGERSIRDDAARV